eukprot:CAMPEP_0196132692 /NCGR_PEP_ID=MMETSP0910-20130528/2202_1 /TAXON_ID=49265 /ORGANISM="Thalassiosira rotula, Strain GSO102" /LENGTH=322 /DNA_ID=CAMNT_0041392317 /DNA_START=74 /DNA_END=1042 /DNA_ORIENTATION=-
MMQQRMQHRRYFASTAISLILLLVQGGADAFQATSTSLLGVSNRLRSSQTVLAGQRNGSHNDEGVDNIIVRSSSRRSFFTQQAPSILAAATIVANTLPILPANAEDDLIDVYFGCGCFWHVQHEFVEAERTILGRADDELTSRAGYAGGKAGASNGKVCYHNAQNIADYGKLGHAEVVSMRIPSSKFEEFAVEYCKLFDKDGNRPDQFGDRGTEYRNVVGIPGGKSSPLAESLVKASLKTGDKLDFAVGKGDDRDLAKVSFIMDTADFPAFGAEQYHQFHDGFKLDENYPNSYNSLAGKFAQKGEDFGKCPNGMIGIGIGGL